MLFAGISYKVWLVSAQVVGYMLSKFYGIRYISAMPLNRRGASIILLITAAWVALLFFGITPAPYNIIFLFLNGFPLGMVWGLVFSYLEGRKATELMGAVLSVSFIFSSGVVKGIGKYFMDSWAVSEWWMPFTTGALFFFPMIVFTFLLNQIPPPTEADEALRTERKPITKQERKQFLARFLPGIVVIVFTYMLLTILRDLRDNFANELWVELGYGSQPSVFVRTEIPVSLIVLLSMALLITVKSNIKAFLTNHYIIIFGYGLSLLSTFLFSQQYINGLMWMTLIGTGLYVSYVPFNCLFFERMIATYRVKSNVGFIMYIADSFGYLASVVILFLKEFIGFKLTWTSFFTNCIIYTSIIGIAGTIFTAVYFKRKYSSTTSAIPTAYAI
jgi:MFS family permease